MGSKKRYQNRVESDSRSAGGNYSHLTHGNRESLIGQAPAGRVPVEIGDSREQLTDMTSDTGECTILASLIRAPRLRMR